MVTRKSTYVPRRNYFVVSLGWNADLGVYIFETRGRKIFSCVKSHVKLMLKLELIAVGDTAVFCSEKGIVRIVGRPSRWGGPVDSKSLWTYPLFDRLTLPVGNC